MPLHNACGHVRPASTKLGLSSIQHLCAYLEHRLRVRPFHPTSLSDLVNALVWTNDFSMAEEPSRKHSQRIRGCYSSVFTLVGFGLDL